MVQDQILTWLKIKGIFAWRNNNGATFDSRRGAYRIRGKHELNGVPDIIGILPDGKFLGIEVKKPGGKTSDDQDLFINNGKLYGAIVFCADDLKTVQTELNKYI